MKDITCPYCEHEQDEPDDCYEPDVRYEVECENCEKTFQVTCEYTRTWYEHETPCLNGAPHKWEKKIGYPQEYFINKYQCQHCDKREEFSTPPVEAKGGVSE